tara:strand:+ start:228 stop:2354 length:2127 start_codon:yes stop_codon:yes gene_type:complete
MATLNFPDAPDTGDTYSDANSGFEYEWNGTVWISKGATKRSNIQEIDDISGAFNGSTTDFILNVASIAIEPVNAQQVVISVGGVLQNVNDDYTIDGSTITFTTAPADGLTFFGTYVNPYLSVNTVADNTVSTGSLVAGSNYTVGGINVTGVSTLTGLTYTGISSISNLSSSNLAVTGVGTIANVIHTKDASGLGATMGAAVGIVTYFGDASNLTGVGATLFPYTYSPGIGTNTAGVADNIVTTWSSSIEAGSGTITIRSGSASGTVVDQFVVGSSSSITIAGNSLTLNPAVDLSNEIEYFVTYPAGSIKALGGVLQNEQLIYSFTTEAAELTLYTWGNNANGGLGLNAAAPAEKSSPTQIGTQTTWNNIYSQWTDSYHSFAGGEQGTLYAWGANQAGELGLNYAGPTGYRSSPTQVGGTTWVDVQSGYYHAVALKTDGTIWAWGSNTAGQLGLNAGDLSGSTGRRSSPTQIGTDTTWGTTEGKLTGGGANSHAIKANGTLWAWGSNTYGGLGLNQTSSASDNTSFLCSSPTQLPGTTWSSLSATSGKVKGAVKTDGTLWVWGETEYGQLGLNQGGPTAKKSSPTQVPGTTWRTFHSANNNSIATKTDGTMWAMGYNASGMVGDNSTVNRSSPTQIPGTTWTGKVAMGSYTVSALKSDGTYWSWGNSYQGSLGLNQAHNFKVSSPTQLPGTWHTEVGGGNNNFMGIKSA